MSGLLARYRDFYGSHPLHLLTMLAGFALLGYIVATIKPADAWNPHVWWQSIMVWFAAAIIAHDLVLFPIYALADRLLTVPAERRRRSESACDELHPGTGVGIRVDAAASSCRASSSRANRRIGPRPGRRKTVPGPVAAVDRGAVRRQRGAVRDPARCWSAAKRVHQPHFRPRTRELTSPPGWPPPAAPPGESQSSTCRPSRPGGPRSRCPPMPSGTTARRARPTPAGPSRSSHPLRHCRIRPCIGRRGAAALLRGRSMRRGSPPRPTFPSASSTVCQRPVPGSGSNTSRCSAGAPLRRASPTAVADWSTPSAGMPRRTRWATRSALGHNPSRWSVRGTSPTTRRSNTSSASASAEPTAHRQRVPPAVVVAHPASLAVQCALVQVAQHVRPPLRRPHEPRVGRTRPRAPRPRRRRCRRRAVRR